MYRSIDEAHVLLVLISTADFQLARSGDPEKNNKFYTSTTRQHHPSINSSDNRILATPDKRLRRKIEPVRVWLRPHRISPPPLLNKIFLSRYHFSTIRPRNCTPTTPPMGLSN